MDLKRKPSKLSWLNTFKRLLARRGESEGLRSRLEQASADLSQSQDSFRTLIDKMPDGLIFVDPFNSLILDCNESEAHMNGYEKAELVGQHVSILHSQAIPMDDPVEYYRTLLQQGVKRYTTTHKHKDGTLFTVEVTTTVMKLGGRDVLLGIDRDITSRQRTESELKTAMERQKKWVAELEQQNQEAVLINEMSNLLQSSIRWEEVYKIIAQFAELLFPGSSGAVYMLNPSRNLLECGTSWGRDAAGCQLALSDPIFSPESCWALRRGQKHLYGGEYRGVCCGHIHPFPALSDDGDTFACFPMSAQNELIGMFHLCFTAGPQVEHWVQLAEKVVMHLGLTIANIKLRERLRQQSIRDPLTHLFNRRYMEETLEREISRSKRNTKPLSLAMLDLDHFKQYNDTLGHEAGDVLLQAFGNFLTANLRGEDILCRYGGDEFVLILPESAQELTVQRIEEIRASWTAQVVPYRDEVLPTVTFSAGVAAYPACGEEPKHLIQCADQALYSAKNKGRNQSLSAGEKSAV